MDKLTAIRTFVSVVQNGGFTGAARRLGVPKTRVSQRVQDLEAQLNVRLLQRTTRTVTPTEEGRIYFEKCLHILDDIDEADQAMQRRDERPSGMLHVTVMSSVAHAVILPRLKHFLGLYPEVSIKVSVSDRLVNLVEESVDCAIRGGALENSSLISRRICSVPFGLYASPAYLQERGPVRTIDDLAGVDRLVDISHRTGMTTAWALHGSEETRTLDTPHRLECDDAEALLTSCVAGCGVALCPTIAAEPLVREGRLVGLLPDWRGQERPIFLVYPSRRYLSAKVRCFVDWASGEIQAASDEARTGHPVSEPSL